MSGHSRFLLPQETLHKVGDVEHGSQEWAYGFQTVPIESDPGEDSNAVLLDVQPHGAVEPVAITELIKLSVRTVEGQGYAVVANTTAPEAPPQLIVMDKETDRLELQAGQAYYYLNPHDKNLVLRDESVPAFLGHEEVSLSSEEGSGILLPKEFWLAFGALQHLSYEQLSSRSRAAGSIEDASYQLTRAVEASSPKVRIVSMPLTPGNLGILTEAH